MRHNAIKTFDGKTAVTTDQITRVSLTRPAGEDNLHVQVLFPLPSMQLVHNFLFFPTVAHYMSLF